MTPTRLARLLSGTVMVTVASVCGAAHDRLMIGGLRVLHPSDRLDISRAMVTEVKQSQDKIHGAVAE